MATQADRLLYNPLFADPNDPKFEEIKQQHFANLLERAMQIEVADRKGDWEIPEMLVNEDRTKLSDPTATQEVDFAAQRLAEAKGKAPPQPPEPTAPQITAEPAQFQAESAPPPQRPSPTLTLPERPPEPAQQTLINTPMPKEGIMVGGTAPPRMDVVPQGPAHPAQDPWEIPATPEQVVSAGGVVMLAAPKETEHDE